MAWFWIVGLIVAVMLGATPPAAAQRVVSVEFVCTVSHLFAGFGLNIWPATERQAPLLGLLDELRVKFVRWKMPPDVEKADIPKGISFDELVDLTERTAQEQVRMSRHDVFGFYAGLERLGIHQLAASWGFPLKWRADASRSAPGEMHQLIADDRVDDFGHLLAAQLAVLARHGTRPYAIELINEPVNKLTPKQYAQVLQSFRPLEGRSGSPATLVTGPGAVFTWGNSPYLQEVTQRRGRIDIVSTHAYDALTTHKLASLEPFVASIPAGEHRPIFVTEYGIDQELWYHSGDAVDGIPYAVRAAAQTLALLGGGANAVFYWQAQDPPWEKQSAWGLLSKEDKRRPAIDALRTIVRPLEVGDKIVASGKHDEALPVAVVARPGQLVVEIANPNAEGQEYGITFRNCGAGPNPVNHSETWPADHAVQVQPVAGAGLHVTVPSNTVASIMAARQP